jgi:hypothetical protein
VVAIRWQSSPGHGRTRFAYNGYNPGSAVGADVSLRRDYPLHLEKTPSSSVQEAHFRDQHVSQFTLQSLCTTSTQLRHLSLVRCTIDHHSMYTSLASLTAMTTVQLVDTPFALDIIPHLLSLPQLRILQLMAPADHNLRLNVGLHATAVVSEDGGTGTGAIWGNSDDLNGGAQSALIGLEVDVPDADVDFFKVFPLILYSYKSVSLSLLAPILGFDHTPSIHSSPLWPRTRPQLHSTFRPKTELNSRATELSAVASYSAPVSQSSARCMCGLQTLNHLLPAPPVSSSSRGCRRCLPDATVSWLYPLLSIAPRTTSARSLQNAARIYKPCASPVAVTSQRSALSSSSPFATCLASPSRAR